MNASPRSSTTWIIIAAIATTVLIVACSNDKSTAVPSTQQPTPSMESTESIGIPLSTLNAELPFPKDLAQQGAILSTAASPDCTLPCWRGLRIGEATQSEVNDAFNQAFGIPHDFFDLPLSGAGSVRNMLPYDRESEMFYGGHTWQVEEGGDYKLWAIMRKDTQTLAAIFEVLPANTFYQAPTVLQIIDTLGPPTWILIPPPANPLDFVMIYQQGIRISLSQGTAYMPNAENDFCFDVSPVNEGFLLTEPYESANPAEWSLMQRAGFHDDIEIEPIEAALGLTVEQFVAAVQSDDHCLKVFLK